MSAMPDKAICKSFANVLRTAEASFGGEVDLLALKSDNGDAVVNELRWLERLTREKCDGLVASLGDDGLWPDVDYESSGASNWAAADHLRRMVALARQPRTGAIASACHKALAGWLETERFNPNWWWNEIGCPKELGVFALLFGDELTADERSAVVKRLSGVQLARTGQNRVWLAECMLLRGLVEGNVEVVAIAKDALAGEISVRDGADGIQSDWSFHQHGKTPQFGNYGIAYLLTLSRWAAVFADAGDGFAEEKLQTLGAFLEKGIKRFVWQGRMDVGALGRQFGKGGMRAKGLAVELAAHYLGHAGWKPARTLDRQGLSVYGQSAMAAYRTKRWMATIKAETQSIQGVEQINGDNLLGSHLADGALFSYVKGDEYEDVFPVWDWGRIPGVTGYASTDLARADATGKAKARNQSEIFERCEGDGVRFVLQRDGLSAETTWRFSEDGVDVEVSRISAASDGEVVTTVEQSRAKPNARWWREGDRIIAVNGGIRYEVPGNAVVGIEPRLGDWHRVMESLSDKPIGTRIFQITIPHGVKPENGACSWKVRFPLVDKGVERPLVSVVVPVYNVEKYVGECLDSLLAQTYGNVEVICVNDGSTDGSAAILERYRGKFGAARKYSVITQPNAGLSAARNAGMDAVTGKYIYFLDSDDMVVPETIANLVNLAEVNALDQIIFNCRTFADGKDPVLIADAEGKARNYYVVPPEANYRMLDGKELFCELMDRGHFYATQQMRFYRREVLVANGLRYPEGLVHEDNYMAPVSLFFAGRAMIVDEKWFLRRIRPNSIMTAGDNLSSRVIALDGIVRRLRDDGRLWEAHPQYAEALKKFISGLARYAACLEGRVQMNDGDAAFADGVVAGMREKHDVALVPRDEARARAEKFRGERDGARALAEKLRSERDEARARAEKLRSERDEARARAEKLRSERDEARALAEKLRGERDEARARAEKLRSERDEACARAEKLQSERDEARARVEKFRGERDEARARVEEVCARLKLAKDETAHRQALVEKLRGERQAARRKVADLQQLIHGMNERFKALGDVVKGV